MKPLLPSLRLLLLLAALYGSTPYSYGQDQESPAESAQHELMLDSSDVRARSFPEKELQEFRDKEEYNYEPPPAVESESLGQWISEQINRFFQRFLFDPEASKWLRISIYLLAGVVLLHFLFRLFGVDFRGVFYKNTDAVSVRSDLQEEELHERDFPKEIDHAVSEHRFREGVRLQYLYVLKILSDRGIIHWEIDKTNKEYSVEISDASLKKPFQKVTDIFERVYYGDFPVSATLYQKLAKDFEGFRSEAVRKAAKAV